MESITHKRLFIGVPIDDQCQQQIDAVLKPLCNDDRIRWTIANNRHLTLTFLGATPDSDLQILQQHFAETYTRKHAFVFELKQLIRFPDVRGHILAAVNIPSPELLELYQHTRDLLNHCHIAFEEREYRPHITLGRIRNPKHLKTSLQHAVSLRLQVNAINLYESIATVSGRQYQVLANAALLP